MLGRILSSRGLMSAAVVLTVVAVAMLGWTLTRPSTPALSYCAEMPDAIGLYKGSAVTIMGVPVGKVTDIAANGATARVRFTVPADRKLAPDVGAVTVNDTIVADRKLALVGVEPPGPGWDPARCITKTLTPKSLSQTFAALSSLADQLNSSSDPARANALGTGLDALDHATTGTGSQINSLITQLSKVLNSPDAAIGHLGQLVDALSALAHRAHNSWPAVQDTMTGLTQTFADINTLAFPQIVRVVDALAETLPQMNDAIRMIAAPGVRALNSIRNLPDLISAGVGSISDILRMAPVIAIGFAQAIDPASGQLRIGYASPKIVLSQGDTTPICAAVQTITGQHCQISTTGALAVPSLPALLSAVSAR